MAQHTVKGIGFRTNGLCATTVDLQRANGILYSCIEPITKHFNQYTSQLSLVQTKIAKYTGFIIPILVRLVNAFKYGRMIFNIQSLPKKIM